jgi:cytoskeleton protein RodZ
MTEAALTMDRGATPAARVGEELRAARRHLGWELPQLASSLRIRQSYLEAIEAGRVGELPGATYALGFVRAYATALGLDAEDMARRFRAVAEDATGKPPLRFPAPVPRRGVPAGAVILLGLVILAGAYAGWYWATEHRAGTRVEVVPPIAEQHAAEAPPPAPSPQVGSILPSTAPPALPAPKPETTAQASPPAPAQSPGTLAAAPPPYSGTQPSQTPAATGAPPGGQAPAPSPSAGQAATSAPGAQPPTPPPPGGSRIVVKATADAWVTVKPQSGPPLLNKLMQAGETWPLPPGTEGATLTTGNAGGTELDVDGAPIPASLGPSGAVRRNLPLDADTLKAGNIPPLPPRGGHKAAAPG